MVEADSQGRWTKNAIADWTSLLDLSIRSQSSIYGNCFFSSKAATTERTFVKTLGAGANLNGRTLELEVVLPKEESSVECVNVFMKVSIFDVKGCKPKAF